MAKNLVSKLPDADMQAAPRALLRAAKRAREIARRTNTPLVVRRDGVLVEEFITDDSDLDAAWRENFDGEPPWLKPGWDADKADSLRNPSTKM